MSRRACEAVSLLEIGEELRFVAQLRVDRLEQSELWRPLLRVVPRGNDAQAASDEIRGFLTIGSRLPQGFGIFRMQPNRGRQRS